MENIASPSRFKGLAGIPLKVERTIATKSAERPMHPYEEERSGGKHG